MKNNTTLIQPVSTEKSSIQQSRGQYTFLVTKDSTKVDIKNAIKAAYGVDVAEVKIMISPKKERFIGRGRIYVKRPVVKKAIITLKDKKASIDPLKFTDTKKK